MPHPPRPSELEMQVLSVLWEHGPLPVRGVLERLPDGKKRAYTTVLSVMQVMEKKGLLDHTRDGNTHVYRPLFTRRQVCRPLIRDLVRNVFGGSAATAMQYLLSDADVNPDELKQIRRLIDQADPGHPSQEEQS
jgi:BlaI family penicillinase repressor